MTKELNNCEKLGSRFY